MPDSLPFAKQILIVLVIYRKDLTEVLTGLRPLFSENPDVYIYDNSPTPQNASGFQIIYKNDRFNSGVSKAYNEAFFVAKQLKKKWMLLLDQDTQVPENLLNSFEQATALHKDVKVFCPRMLDRRGIVSPYRLMWGKSVRTKKINAGLHRLEKWMLINSGTLINTESFKKSGGFDERFPLDFSDVVFFSRLRTLCSHFIVIPESCAHHLSSSYRMADLDQVFDRFKHYTTAARHYQKISHGFVWMGIPIFTLCLKLSIRYRTLKFIKIIFGST